MSELERVAIHESAHGCVALRMRLPLTVLSVRSTAHYRGVCGMGRMAAITEYDPGRPMLAQPSRPRRLLEARIRAALAGPLADRLWWPPPATSRTTSRRPLWSA